MSTKSITEVFNAMEKSLDDFNDTVQSYLFDKISPRRYSEFIASNPEYAARLQEIMENEVKLRDKIQQRKSLHEMKAEIQQLGADEEVMKANQQAQAAMQQAQADREKLLKSIMGQSVDAEKMTENPI